MRTIAVVNQKGGVGKTTTSVNLGAALALRGHRVLLVDMDPQGNLTDHLLGDAGAGSNAGDGARHSVYDVLVEGGRVVDGVVPTSTPGLFVLPSHEDMAGAELDLAAVIGREVILRDALAALPAESFDYAFLDCPPSLGLLSLNALAAADEVFIALQTEFFAMRGLSALDRTIDLVQRRINPRLRLSGIVPTLVDPTRLSREVMDEVRSHYGDRVFSTRVRTNIRLAEAPSHGKHIFEYAPDSAGAADYAALAAEVDEGPRTSADPAGGESSASAPVTARDDMPAVAVASGAAPASVAEGAGRPAARRGIARAIAEAAAAVGATPASAPSRPTSRPPEAATPEPATPSSTAAGPASPPPASTPPATASAASAEAPVAPSPPPRTSAPTSSVAPSPAIAFDSPVSLESAAGDVASIDEATTSPAALLRAPSAPVPAPAAAPAAAPVAAPAAAPVAAPVAASAASIAQAGVAASPVAPRRPPVALPVLRAGARPLSLAAMPTRPLSAIPRRGPAGAASSAVVAVPSSPAGSGTRAS